jgi:hypothetical protein
VSPVGDTAREVERLAQAAGIDLRPGRALGWLTSRGHQHEPLREALAVEALTALEGVFAQLDGDAAALGAKAARPLRPDFLLGEREQLVELDESQHFTSARLRTLAFYSAAGLDTFDVDEYRALCNRLRAKSDRDFAHRTAVEFPGLHGRQRQRAYFDAVRDFGAPACGNGPIIRVPAPERDAALAFARFRQRTGL